MYAVPGTPELVQENHGEQRFLNRWSKSQEAEHAPSRANNLPSPRDSASENLGYPVCNTDDFPKESSPVGSRSRKIIAATRVGVEFGNQFFCEFLAGRFGAEWCREFLDEAASALPVWGRPTAARVRHVSGARPRAGLLG